MVCKSCGTENEEGAKFCRNCGLPIVPESETIQPDYDYDKSETDAEDTVTEPADGDAGEPVSQSQPSQSETQQTYAAGQYGQPQNTYQGQPGNQGQPAYQGQPGYQGQQGYQGQPGYQGRPPKVTPGTSIAALILGIVSVVCCFTGIISIGCGIAAIIIYAVKKQKDVKDGMLTAGLILGIVGIGLTIIAIIMVFATGAYAAWVSGGEFNFWDFLRYAGDSGSSGGYSGDISDFFNNVG